MAVKKRFNKKLGCFVYDIDYYVDGKRVRECVGPVSKAEAQKILTKRKYEIDAGSYVGKKADIPFDKLMDEFLEIHCRANNKESSYTRNVVISKQLLKFFGKKALSQVTVKSIEEYKAVRKKKVEPASVNRELAMLKHIFNKAKAWGHARENPVEKVKFYREPERIRYLSPEEIRRLFDIMKKENKKAPHLKPMVILALYTGMRRGEILWLKWSEVDFENRIIHLATSKSGKPRTIELCDTVYNTLAVLKHTSKYVFPSDKTGRPFTDIKNAFHALIKKAAIQDFRFHDLRHTFASLNAMRGENAFVIKELLGHSTLEMSLRYSHLSRDKERTTMSEYGAYMDTLLSGREGQKIKGLGGVMDTGEDNPGKIIGHA